MPLEALPGDAERGTSVPAPASGTRSFLGAPVLHFGGLLLDQGRLRVYGGGGDPGRPGPAEVNRFPAGVDPAWQPLDGLVIGHDALGGRFALNCHGPATAGRAGPSGLLRAGLADVGALGIGHATWMTSASAESSA
ncbi:DUF2625 family protein [Actinoallomurus acaciae]|uniref:DUF2625 family protein n=1 Tax=Actinoallomurus acaciae TaxID=502577 RepID=A0ABV5YLF9_9ACTN